MLVTDGHTPINLMGFGQGLLGGMSGKTINSRPKNYHVEENE
jgi:hypothetical protein